MYVKRWLEALIENLQRNKMSKKLNNLFKIILLQSGMSGIKLSCLSDSKARSLSYTSGFQIVLHLVTTPTGIHEPPGAPDWSSCPPLSCMIICSLCMDFFEGKLQKLNKFENQHPTLHLLALRNESGSYILKHFAVTKKWGGRILVMKDTGMFLQS